MSSSSSSSSYDSYDSSSFSNSTQSSSSRSFHRKKSSPQKRAIQNKTYRVHSLSRPLSRTLSLQKQKRKNPLTFLQQRQASLPLEDALQKIKPLDIIAFRGDEFVSDLIAKLENKILAPELKEMYSHVGMVVTSEILDDPLLEPGKLYIWEATMSGKLGQNIYSIHHPKKMFLGTLVRPLKELLINYDKNNKAYYAWCPLRNYPRFDHAFRIRFSTLFKRYNNRPYDANPIALAASLFKICRPCRDSLEKKLNTENWMFCSELIAQVFQDLQMIPRSVTSNNVVPMDLLGFDNEIGDENVPPNLIQDIIKLVH